MYIFYFTEFRLARYCPLFALLMSLLFWNDNTREALNLLNFKYVLRLYLYYNFV